MAKFGGFFFAHEHEKDNRQLDSEIQEVNAEIRKRTNNGLDCEDQEARLQNLYDAKHRKN
ncbi:hypothetical protein [Actinophytocola sp. NPDC049390]|uniref:hypothetical protein n=1 Tax=Actinophytocola sp. NPDC049390 TaxID=3363894 RepID=UPI0037AF0C9B